MHFIYVLWLHAFVEAKRFTRDGPQMYKTVNQRVNNNPAFPDAVDFGHVYRNEERNRDLEDDIPMPNNAKELLQDFRKPQWTPKPDSLIFLSPRDEIQYYNKHRNLEMDVIKESGLNDTQLKRPSRPTWYDFPKLLERNLANPTAGRKSRILETKPSGTFNKIDIKARRNTTTLFEENAFYMRPSKKSTNLIWTSCDEFAKRAVFHPDDVVNTKWLPFYIWSTRGFTSSYIHTFSYPTKKIVQYYKTNYKPYIKKLNWYEPKLLLKETREILLIAGDRKGLFYGIPKQDLSDLINGINMTLPILTLRMKIHDPYLALMFCDEKYAVIMAEMGTGPDNDNDKTLEARTLNFSGKGKPARRNFELERLDVELQKKRKIDAEARKFIHIETPPGDVDFNVKHS